MCPRPSAVLAVGWLLVSAADAAAAPTDVVVTIYATRADGTGQGTGFFTTRDGRILTAYHVVQGAREIQVVHQQLGSFTNVLVDSVSPERDLAVLQLLNPMVSTPFVAMDSGYVPSTADNFEIWGFPSNGARATVRTHSIHSGFVSSLTILDRRNRPYFASDISILQLDATIYNGISGGPVVGPRGVVGVLSGSRDEGGGFAWAIPLQHMSSLRRVNLDVREMNTWPPFTLMAANWNNLRSNVQTNTTAAAMLDDLNDQIEGLARHYNELNRIAIDGRIKIGGARPFLERLVAQGASANAADARVPARAAMESLQNFSSVSTSMAESWRQTAAALTTLMTWITGDARLDDRTGRALVDELRRIRDEYNDLQRGIDAYLGLDARKVAAALPEFQASMKNATVAGEGKAFLRLFDSYRPVLDAYGSPKGMTFMSRDIAKYRRTALLFEPVVFRTIATR